MTATGRPASALWKWQSAAIGSTITSLGRRAPHASQNAAHTDAASAPTPACTSTCVGGASAIVRTISCDITP